MNVAKQKIIVALDAPTLSKAESLVQSLKGSVDIFKVGKELFTAEGPKAVQMVHGYGAKVFLDLKFHDIPNTVASACAAAASMGVFMLNVHASGGRKMMSAAAEALQMFSRNRNVSKSILIGVTVLTSMDETDLNLVGVHKALATQVKDLATLCENSGLDGVVASPQEIEIIRKNTRKDFVIVTPGVRPLWSATGDQKRVMTPSQAIALGADYLVIGRPITAHDDPKAATQKILQEIEG